MQVLYRFAAHPLVRRWAFVTLLILGAIFLAYQFPYTYSIQVAEPRADWFIAGFNGAENDGRQSFRWSSAKSDLIFPGVVQNQSYQLNLHLAAGGRPQDAPDADVTLLVNKLPIQTFSVEPEFATYSAELDPRTFPSTSNLVVELQVPTFKPSQFVPASKDNRSLGVMIDSVNLQPADSRPFLALPPWQLVLSWLIVATAWFAVLEQAGVGKQKYVWAFGASGGAVLLALGLILMRGWIVAAVWYVLGALLVLWVGAFTLPRWWRRAAEGNGFSFLYTLGIKNQRARGLVEIFVGAAILIYYSLTVLAPLRTEPLGDFVSYYAAAGVWLQGGDFYDYPQLQNYNLQHALIDRKIPPFIYPPPAVLMIVPLALLPLATAKTVWLILCGALLVGASFLLWDALRLSSARPVSPIWLGLMIAFSGSLQNSLAYGQVGALIFFLLALALWAWLRGRAILTGATIVSGAALKLFPALLFLYALNARAWRNFFSTIFAGVVFLIATTLLTGIQSWITYITQVLPPYAEVRASLFNQSLNAALRRTTFALGVVTENPFEGPQSTGMRIATAVLTLALLGLAAWWFRRSVDPSKFRTQVEFATVIVLMLLSVPLVWEHYLMWLMIPLFLILNAMVNLRMPPLVQLVCVLLWLTCWFFSQDAPSFFTRPDWSPLLSSIGLDAMLLLYGTLLYLWTRVPKLESATAPLISDATTAAHALALVPKQNSRA